MAETRYRTLTIVLRTDEHAPHCALCGTVKKKDLKGAVAAEFHPEHSKQQASVYCIDCIRRLYAAAHPRKAG